MARYKQLLFYASKLESLPDEDHVPGNKVEGCVSQVWVKPELRADGQVHWRADSDSQLTKGLAALLVLGLSGCTPKEIITLTPEFMELLGLKQSLTPSRNNGFLNMFRLMQRKALELAAPAQGDAEASSGAPAPHAAPATSSSGTPIEDAMRAKISAALSPLVLDIQNNSASHAGHAAMRVLQPGKAGPTAETHFRVMVVSEAFASKGLVQRHRMINAMLEPEFGLGLHALSLDTKTPAEAQAGQA